MRLGDSIEHKKTQTKSFYVDRNVTCIIDY